MFYDSLNDDGIIYASYPTFDTLLYRDYASVEKDENGMIVIDQSGSIDHSLSVNLPYSEEELYQKYNKYNIIDILTSNLPIMSNENEKEYHVIAQKRNK